MTQVKFYDHDNQITHGGILLDDKGKETMNEYIKEIEQIAARCTESQSDGYSQIMRICDGIRRLYV